MLLSFIKMIFTRQKETEILIWYFFNNNNFNLLQSTEMSFELTNSHVKIRSNDNALQVHNIVCLM